MKICIISSSYPNDDGVGNTFVEQLVNAIAKLGNQCTVISPLNVYGNKSVSSYKEYEVKTLARGHAVSVFRPRFWSRNIPFLPVSTNRFFAKRAIEKTIKANKLEFDLFYCHFFASGLLAWHYAHQNKIPLFVATGESTIKASLQKPCRSFSWAQFKQDTNGIICVSSKNLEECVSLGYAEREKCRVFPNGMNPELFKPLDKKLCREKLGFPDESFIIITVGEFSHRKGQERIIKAIDSLSMPFIKAVFIGSGEPLPKRDYILYSGKVKHQDIATFLSAADAFVLPTLKEGCCNAIVEAMACGLPIISSDRTFNYDILNDTNSIMVDPENVKEISTAIKQLIDNKLLRDNLSSGSLASSKKLSIQKRAENILDFISQAMR